MRGEFGLYTFELSGQVRHRLGVRGHGAARESLPLQIRLGAGYPRLLFL